MEENKLKELYDLLIDFATLPCQDDRACSEFCPILNYCSMLYSLSRGIKGELTIDETFNKIEADYKNIRWEEDNE